MTLSPLWILNLLHYFSLRKLLRLISLFLQQISSVMSCFKHTCRHSACCGLQLTSSGSIIGASSDLGERAGDEESLFSHSVRPGMLSPVSRKERFSSLMLVWCLTISSGGEVSYSSRSTMIQGDEARSSAEGTTAMLYVRSGSLHIQWITNKTLGSIKYSFERVWNQPVQT